jgi:hypothetical protein
MSARADKNQDSPTHYTALQFLVGFSSFMYDGNLEWAKKNDPSFGVGSYSHICRLMPEHLYVMHIQMEVLIRNNYTGWQEIPELNGYVRALCGVNPAGDVEKGGIEMFDQLPKLFLQKFKNK